MITYSGLGMRGFSRSKELYLLIKWGEITLGGNCKDKIYGTLQCRSGKRLKPQNRVFFTNEQEAIEASYRPCAHCMPAVYKAWKRAAGQLKHLKMETKEIINLLPFDGQVDYYGKVMSDEEASIYLDILMNNITWKNDEAVIFGKHFITKRMVAWYGDANYNYSYSNKTREALPWTKELLELKKLVEEYTGVVYNSCLLNLYHNGEEGMGWHSDDERALGKDSSIASLSFGAGRKFALKHRQTKEGTSIILENGSLLEMKGTTQTYWMHSLPKSTRVKEPRVNLTFRTMIPQ